MSSMSRRPSAEFSQIAITGIGARLPGASSEEEFWRLLMEGRCAVGPLPAGRWRSERYYHPRVGEAGFSYSFAGGYIDNPLDFDPSVFGISPREAAEMDPQQRLLLEVVWGALEDSGIPPSALAGTNVGVYVGASSLDYGNLHGADPAAIESHFMTGNTLSILANRISYIFDFRGPSFTVDTACSSSLVAFAEAQAAISAGRIDIAIVAGVNMLLAPTSFIGFARASMLSPTGLCRPFSAAGDGYVRAEGAVAMVVSRLSTATDRGYPVRAVALASGINSDGKTSGISLPSMEGQRELLERLYGAGAIDPNRLAFVEAHGTGTRVGDPAEATAIGQALGRTRTAPLPIGSVKSNIGHLEPASGLAGVYKAILALEHRHLPRTLHAEDRNPEIDFAGLNLALATDAVALPQTGTWLAGISSFGFGGTNAHVVISSPTDAEPPVSRNGRKAVPLLMLSAYSRSALNATARDTAALIEAGNGGSDVAAAIAWQRDLAAYRLAVPLDDSAHLVAALRNFAETGNIANGVSGVAPSVAPKICFVFSGNGCQWAGMGRAAFAGNEAFRRHFHSIDRLFMELADWSPVEALHAADLAERMKLTRVAQPMLFAIQSSLSAGLAASGLKPDMVLGHSVGEVAAAEAAGAIDLAEAVRIIYLRSEHQEGAFGLGTMAVASQSPEAAAELIADSGEQGLEIAAFNSPTSVTISGPEEAIRAFAKFARKRRVAVRVLDLAYPFHSAILEPLRQPLLTSLGDVAAGRNSIPFLSSVTGAEQDGSHLDGEYWWRNVREPVQFSGAVTAAAAKGASLFIEIGPRPILTANITDILRDGGFDGAALSSLSEKEDPHADPLVMIAARAMVLGCRFDIRQMFGPRPTARVRLPAYPWQHKTYPRPQTTEALDLYGSAPRHPLIGARLAAGIPEWRNLIDATTVPYLADHRIDGEIVMPGTGFAEMALAVAREIFPEGPIGLEDFDLLQWLPLPADSMRELSVRFSGDTHVVEIWNRPRLSNDEWTLCARGRIIRVASPTPAVIPKRDLPQRLTADQVYDSATKAGVTYGPLFRRVLGATRSDTLIDVELSPFEEASGVADRRQILHPIALDSAFHAMFENIKARAGERYAFLPVRFAGLRVDRDSAVPARARVDVVRETDDSLTIAVDLYDADGLFIAGLSGGLFRAVTLDRSKLANVFFHRQLTRLLRRDEDPRAAAMAALGKDLPDARPDSWLILEAFARSLAFSGLQSLFAGRPFQPDDAASPWIVALLDHLHAAGLAYETQEGWVLAAESGLPAAKDILATFAAEYAGATPEIVLAAQALTRFDASQVELRPALLEQFETGAILFAPLLSAARALCEELEARIAPEPLRILVAEPSCAGLLRCLAPLVRQGRARVTVIGTDARRVNQAAARRGPVEGVVFEAVEGDADNDTGAQFDLALTFAFGPIFAGDPALGRAVARRLAPGGLLCAFLPPDSISFDLLLGATEGWFAEPLDPRYPMGRVRAAQDYARLLVASGFGAIDSRVLPDDMGTVLLAAADRPATAVPRASAPVVVVDRPSVLLDHLVRTLRVDGAGVRLLPAAQAGQMADDGVELVFPALFGADFALDAAIAQLAALLEAVQGRKCRLWVVVQGLDSAQGAAIDPRAEALWCFTRVAINEYPGLQIKLVDIAEALDGDVAARLFADLLASETAEGELLIDDHGVSAIRLRSGLDRGATEAEVPAVCIKLRTRGMLAHFDWVEMPRRPPGPHEVEVAIESSGLNFRDIMLATGLLDDDVLDDGLAGAVFGFEGAGRVVAVGSDVATLKLGDAVTGFGRQSFASHTTADADVFSVLPEGMSLEAAATIPVAFLTAWYALVHQAQIQPGEWVLIHGAAGGVGLAAMQIARLKGARIAATVSTGDKRALASLFGAERIYHSRSTAFLDEIRQDIGGVDVVLNSLAGDAMLASVKCLKPFGRFVELGKRDYVLNTAMGLRPFRRNLSYFGVDLDQLLAGNLPLAKRLMGELMGHFATGALSPLPYRSFDWFEAGEAFQMMQAAGHVGKLLVRPAMRPIATSVVGDAFDAGPGCHLVVGGAGGFGFETAVWLADRGARTIVVASRRGRLEPHLDARAAVLRASGVRLLVEALDVTDAGAVEALIARLARDHGRLAGIMHAAMVLDDGMIAGLQPDRTRAVLAPKVEGAVNLDRATRDMALDYFVAFSSVTTMIGNPGQGAYVAANGFLQGLMRRRRALGLPGLAVGWGAIADVGVLARDGESAAKLERISGIVAMPAAEALSHLQRLMAYPDSCPATVYCAAFRPGAAMQGMKLLTMPTAAQLFTAAEGSVGEQAVDLPGLIAGKSEIEARSLVAGLVVHEVARILRLTSEEIDVTRPLDDLGMDSLMSLELRMAIEGRFGVELPVVAISSGVNVNELAARLINGAKAGTEPKPGGEQTVGPGALERHLIQQHGLGDVGSNALMAVAEAIEENRSAVTSLI